jgi:hypothetical protein
VDPIEVRADGGSVIFPLPNGLPGYGIFDETGILIESSDLLLDFNTNDFKVHAGVSCMNCHVQVLVPVVDEVRRAFDPDSEALVSGEVNAVQRLYPEAADWDNLLRVDSARYDAAKQILGAAEAPDPAARAALLFSLVPSLESKTGDLMSVNAPGTADFAELLSRAEFGEGFASQLCSSLATARNKPRGCLP